MKSKLLFFLKYLFFWISIFEFFRLVFIIYHLAKFKSLPFSDILLTFVYGLKLDLSLTGYILIPPVIVLIIFSIFKNNFIKPFFTFYTPILLFFVVFLYLIDLELYNYWGFRLDDTPFEYIDTPGEMIANVSVIQLVLGLSSLILVIYLINRFYYKKWVSGSLGKNIKFDWKAVVFFILFSPALSLMIRGGFKTAPLNTGAVYFSTLINHVAVNPIWNLIYAFTEVERLTYSTNFYNEGELDKYINEIYPDGNYEKQDILNGKPNIIVIILESFGCQVIEKLNGEPGITPNFNRLIPEGIFFDNFYCTGHLSDRGISGILSGYPGLPKTTILHFENKTQNIPSISKDLKNLGYQSTFFYGGDIEFAHIKSYLINSGFDEIISDIDFPKKIERSKWGVPDHVLFEKLLEETDKTENPFFHVCFTLSSHSPFDVPMKPAFETNSKEDKFFNSVYYTDKYLGKFMDEARKRDWFQNTLIILVADHGSRLSEMTYYDRDRFHIPMLWLGGALNVKDSIIYNYGSQTDVSKTLLNQLGLNVSQYKFGKDLFNPNAQSFAYYSCQNGFGYINDSTIVIFDLGTNKPLLEEGKNPEEAFNKGKAYLQYLVYDFEGR